MRYAIADRTSHRLQDGESTKPGVVVVEAESAKAAWQILERWLKACHAESALRCVLKIKKIENFRPASKAAKEVEAYIKSQKVKGPIPPYKAPGTERAQMDDAVTWLVRAERIPELRGSMAIMETKIFLLNCCP